MQVVKYTHLTKEMIEKFTDIFIEGFQHNEFIYTYLIGENSKTLRKFMKMIVAYNNHFADYYALIREDGKWVAAVVYLPIGCEPLGLSSAFKRGKLLFLISFFLTQPAKYRKRIIQFSNFEDKNWYKEPFITLDTVASIEKGCGKALIEATIPNYNGQNIALNSSVNHKEHSYYKQFGFEAYEEIMLDHYKTVMMVRKA